MCYEYSTNKLTRFELKCTLPPHTDFWTCLYQLFKNNGAIRIFRPDLVSKLWPWNFGILSFSRMGSTLRGYHIFHDFSFFSIIIEYVYTCVVVKKNKYIDMRGLLYLCRYIKSSNSNVTYIIQNTSLSTFVYIIIL